MTNQPGFREHDTLGEVTWADFIQLPDDDRRELIDGRLVEVEVPTKLHEHVVALLTWALVGWARENGGLALASGYKIRIDDRRGVMPDVQFFCKGRGSTGEQGLEDGAPDLAVEIISPSSQRHDRVVKREWYARIGTPEYWIVDPSAGTVERYLLRGEELVLDARLDEGTFEPDSFPGLSIELDDLFTLTE